MTAEYIKMQITELSARIDHKLTELEQQLTSLQSRHAQTQDPQQQQQLATDIAALTAVRTKLRKSKDIAWRAHQLQSESDTDRRYDQQRLLGLVLCIISGAAAIVLVGVYFLSGIF